MSYNEKILLLKKFAQFKAKQKKGSSIVIETMPRLGVQVDSEFYSFELIFEAIKVKVGA